MIIFLTILSFLGGLIALLLIVATFTKKNYSIQSQITIHAPKEKVFRYLKHLKNQEHFSTWVQMDPQMKKSFRGGEDGNVGFVFAWDGNKKAGAGEQEIKKIIEGERLEVEIRFIRPFAGIAQTPFTTETISGNQTNVTWGMSSRMSYPMNIMLLFINMDKALGKDLEASLENLKKILEKE